MGCRDVSVEKGSSCWDAESKGGRQVQQARGKGRVSESAHTKSDFSTMRDDNLTGKKVYDPLSHANAASGAAALSPRSFPMGGVGLVGWGHRWRIPFSQGSRQCG